MAAVTSFIRGSRRNILRNATAQATTGQTDWVSVPAWATDMVIYLNLSDVGVSTTPLMDFVLLELDPVASNDSTVANFAQWDGITQLTAATFVTAYVGPGITGATDDDTAAIYKINSCLPSVLGFKITLDRTTGDEVYTYSLVADFHARS